jgi:uncharacterized protein (DUF2252 family)
MFKKKYDTGKEIRGKVPRSGHAKWKAPHNRPSVKKMIQLSDYDRLPDLIPVRHYRMSASPFVFYRATASIMARDLSYTPSSGITIQACGDCHLMNFGGFATPERHLIMDINDFDETLPGYWEWDIKRLTTSFILAAREKQFSEKTAEEVARKLLSAYQEALNEYSNMKFIDLWYLKFDLEEMAEQHKDQARDPLAKMLTKVKNQTHDAAFYKMTIDNMEQFNITEKPSLIIHPFKVKESMDMIETFLDQYKNTLQPDRRFLFGEYKVTDVALKVVGVGSVGLRCYVVLLLNDNKEPVFIQVKEASQSVLEPYIKPSLYQHHGERIVQGQRLTQSASDIFLGWTTDPRGRHFYLRQLKDKKISPNVESMNKETLILYAQFCARILAKAHCKTNTGAIICGYIGKGNQFARAVTGFAKLYADQTEKDYEAFMRAIKSGKLSIAEDFELAEV